MCPTFLCNLTHCTVYIQLSYRVQKNCKSALQLYSYSTLLGAAIKCKPYSEITVEIGTHLKTVKITLNIFAV